MKFLESLGCSQMSRVFESKLYPIESMKSTSKQSFSSSKNLKNSLAKQKMNANQWCCVVLSCKKISKFLIQIILFFCLLLPKTNITNSTFPTTSLILIQTYWRTLIFYDVFSTMSRTFLPCLTLKYYQCCNLFLYYAQHS